MNFYLTKIFDIWIPFVLVWIYARFLIKKKKDMQQATKVYCIAQGTVVDILY